MNSQAEQPNPPPHKKSCSPSASSSSSIRKYVSKRRYCLAAFACIMVVVMAIGIVFAAHHYYHDFGGQGFLKQRDQIKISETLEEPKLYLPLRMVEIASDDAVAGFPTRKRTPMEVPFYICGDQQNSCEDFNQPNICCPVGMTCYPTTFTPSNIFCCNSINSQSECQYEASPFSPPKCLPSSVECSAEAGGGCCPSELQCSPNGCVQVTDPSTTIPSPIQQDDPVTVIESPASTATVVKEGEVAQKGVGVRGSVVLKLCIPYVSAWVLVCMGALMGML